MIATDNLSPCRQACSTAVCAGCRAPLSCAQVEGLLLPKLAHLREPLSTMAGLLSKVVVVLALVAGAAAQQSVVSGTDATLDQCQVCLPSRSS